MWGRGRGEEVEEREEGAGQEMGLHYVHKKLIHDFLYIHVTLSDFLVGALHTIQCQYL